MTACTKMGWSIALIKYLFFFPVGFNKPAKQSGKGYNRDASIQITNFLNTPESLTYYFNLRTWKKNHILIHTIVHVKNNTCLFNCHDVSFLELLWYYAKLTYLHTYFLVTMQWAWSFEPQKRLRYCSKNDQNSLSDIIGDIRTKNSQIDFWAESDTKRLGSIL